MPWSSGVATVDGLVIDYLHGDEAYWRIVYQDEVMYSLTVLAAIMGAVE